MGIDLGGSIKFKSEEDISKQLKDIFFVQKYNCDFDLALKHELIENGNKYCFIQEAIEEVLKNHTMYYDKALTSIWNIHYINKTKEIELLYQRKYKPFHCSLTRWIDPTIDDIRTYTKEIYSSIVDKLKEHKINTNNLSVSLWMDRDGSGNSRCTKNIDLHYILREEKDISQK